MDFSLIKMEIIEGYRHMVKKYIISILSMLVFVLSSCNTARYKTEYYPSGKRFEYGKVVNEKKEGLWVRWYESGEKQGEYSYHENKLNGLATQWFKNGVVQALAKYRDNQFIDTLKFFFSNGKPNYIKYFTYDGLQNGKFIIWHQNGNVSQLGYYIRGKEDGECFGFLWVPVKYFKMYFNKK